MRVAEVDMRWEHRRRTTRSPLALPHLASEQRLRPCSPADVRGLERPALRPRRGALRASSPPRGSGREPAALVRGARSRLCTPSSMTGVI